MIEKANGDTGKAIGDLDQAIKRDPRPADVYLLRADLHKKKGENDLALADLDAALSRAPDDAGCLLARAQILQAKGDMTGAIADYDAAIKRAPGNADALRGRGAALLAAKSYARAADDFDALIRLNPKSAEAYYQRGQVYELSDERSKAAMDYKAALSRDKGMLDARKALARVAAAERAQKRVGKREPNAEAAVKVEAKLPSPPNYKKTMDVDGKDAALSAAAPQKPDVTALLPSKEAKAPREQPKINSKINSKIGPKISPKIAALPSSKQEAKPIVHEPETPHGAMPKLESGSHSNARPRKDHEKTGAYRKPQALCRRRPRSQPAGRQSCDRSPRHALHRYLERQALRNFAT